MKILSPQLDINTAAGGGSRLFFRTGVSVVNESAKAHPGPCCYRKGGLLALTDANLFLGRPLLDHFPKIFGPARTSRWHASAGDRGGHADVNAFHAAEAAAAGRRRRAARAEEVACGSAAPTSRCAGRSASFGARGYDPAQHVLRFGGAGAQHVCATARCSACAPPSCTPTQASSAYGMGLADTVVEGRACRAVRPTRVERIRRSWRAGGAATAELASQGVPLRGCRSRCLNMRYGHDNAIMVPAADGDYGRWRRPSP